MFDFVVSAATRAELARCVVADGTETALVADADAHELAWPELLMRCRLVALAAIVVVRAELPVVDDDDLRADVASAVGVLCDERARTEALELAQSSSIGEPLGEVLAWLRQHASVFGIEGLPDAFASLADGMGHEDASRIVRATRELDAVGGPSLRPFLRVAIGGDAEEGDLGESLCGPWPSQVALDGERLWKPSPWERDGDIIEAAMASRSPEGASWQGLPAAFAAVARVDPDDGWEAVKEALNKREPAWTTLSVAALMMMMADLAEHLRAGAGAMAHLLDQLAVGGCVRWHRDEPRAAISDPIVERRYFPPHGGDKWDTTWQVIALDRAWLVVVERASR